ncbi:MAG TPA: hypothetical protein VFI21_11030 [Nocardioides sp.]|nr:hypothetical protein [Nocardioides sp.]
MSLSRRGLLIGAGGAAAALGTLGVAVDEGLLPGRTRLQHALGLTDPAGHVPDVRPGYAVSGSFASRHRLGAETGWSVLYPGPRPRRPPRRRGLRRHGDRRVPAAAQQAGPGHRAAGLPRLLDGRLRLAAARADRRRTLVRAVAALSAAIWQPGGGFSSSGFASQAEYDRFTVFGRQSGLDGIPLRLDCGTDDPFCPADRAYVAGFARPVTSTFTAGGHDPAYWTRMLPAQLSFVGRALGSSP